MEELNLKELLNYYIKKIPIIILTSLLTLLLGYAYIEYIQVPMYHGSTTIILVQNSERSINETMTQNELTVNEKLVKTYGEIITSRTVLEKVIEMLELNIEPSELSEKIKVNSISDTSILEVTVSDENNEKAATIANKLAEVFKDEVTQIYKLENVSIIDKAIIEEEPYNVNLIKQLMIYTIIGAIIACIFIFIIYYFDNTIKNKKEIETKINLPVLGEVPSAAKLLKQETKAQNKKKKIHELKKINLKKVFPVKFALKKDNKKMFKIEELKQENVTEKQEKITKVKKNVTLTNSKTSTSKKSSSSSNKKKIDSKTNKKVTKKKEGGKKNERTNSK